jgi:hypothetical protein
MGCRERRVSAGTVAGERIAHVTAVNAACSECAPACARLRFWARCGTLLRLRAAFARAMLFTLTSVSCITASLSSKSCIALVRFVTNSSVQCLRNNF